MIVWLLAGVLVGVVNGLTRWWTVDRLGGDVQRGTLLVTLSGMMFRLALIAALLTSGLRRGIGPGLLAFGGLWFTRISGVMWAHASGGLWRSAGSHAADETVTLERT